jgi:hypothetical protein
MVFWELAPRLNNQSIIRTKCVFRNKVEEHSFKQSQTNC